MLGVFNGSPRLQVSTWWCWPDTLTQLAAHTHTREAHSPTHATTSLAAGHLPTKLLAWPCSSFSSDTSATTKGTTSSALHAVLEDAGFLSFPAIMSVMKHSVVGRSSNSNLDTATVATKLQRLNESMGPQLLNQVGDCGEQGLCALAAVATRQVDAAVLQPTTTSTHSCCRLILCWPLSTSSDADKGACVAA